MHQSGLSMVGNTPWQRSTNLPADLDQSPCLDDSSVATAASVVSFTLLRQQLSPWNFRETLDRMVRTACSRWVRKSVCLSGGSEQVCVCQVGQEEGVPVNQVLYMPLALVLVSALKAGSSWTCGGMNESHSVRNLVTVSIAVLSIHFTK